MVTRQPNTNCFKGNCFRRNCFRRFLLKHLNVSAELQMFQQKMFQQKMFQQESKCFSRNQNVSAELQIFQQKLFEQNYRIGVPLILTCNPLLSRDTIASTFAHHPFLCAILCVLFVHTLNKQCAKKRSTIFSVSLIDCSHCL
jgi:hypothetical protein